MTLKVTRFDPAVKGITSAGAKKPALLETGVEIEVRWLTATCSCTFYTAVDLGHDVHILT